MSRYIDLDHPLVYKGGYDMNGHIIYHVPSNTPTADVRENVKGEWKPFDLTWGRSVYSCSACGDTWEVPTDMGTPIYNYCPNCGAMMKGESGEESL